MTARYGRGRRRSASREEMLEVAKQHAITYGWRHARVQQIAADAGVSRPTLYKEFASKSELGSALLLYEVAKFLRELNEAIDASDGTLRDAIAVGCLYALTEADRGPFLAAVLTEDRTSEDSLIPGLTSGGENSIVPTATSEVLQALSARVPEGTDPGRLAFIASAAVRLTISELVEPSTESRAEISKRIAEMCTAYLGLE